MRLLSSTVCTMAMFSVVVVTSTTADDTSSLSDVPSDQPSDIPSAQPIPGQNIALREPTDCLDKPGWYDVHGDGCWWYEYYAEPGCAGFGGKYDGGLGTANEACCYCGGGDPTATCVDTPNFVDAFYNYCSDYQYKPELDCSTLDDDGYDAGYGTPSEACCFCGGGSRTPQPSTQPSSSLSPTEACFDVPGFIDRYGRTCEDYKVEGYDWCVGNDDDWYDVGYGTPRKACCYCGGGTSLPPPTTMPTTTPAPSELCVDTPGFRDGYDQSCKDYEARQMVCSDYRDRRWYDIGFGIAEEACCYCGGGSGTAPPSRLPVTQAPSSTCFNVPGYSDARGRSCAYFRHYQVKCSGLDHSSLDIGLGTPSDACCYCGGGSAVPPPTLAPTDVCYDKEGWYDSVGDGCWWYEENVEQGCSSVAGHFDGGQGTAQEACCYCGGGSSEAPPSMGPSTTTLSPTVECYNVPGWKDVDGDGCDWYVNNVEPGCSSIAGRFDGGFGSADEACCYCGGGTLMPPPSTTPSTTISPSEACYDLPGFVDRRGNKCYDFQMGYLSCSHYDDDYYDVGYGTAGVACCVCGGGSSTLAPTITPSTSNAPSETCHDIALFVDRYGYRCHDYGEGLRSCYDYDDDWYDVGYGTAVDACCSCGGGSTTRTPTVMPSMTPEPSEVCYDVSGFLDRYGYTCDHYRKGQVPCEGNRTAVESCCFCGGGSTTPPPTQAPSTTLVPTDVCFDVIGFVDAYGYTCKAYEVQKRDCSYYTWYGDDAGYGFAVDACCYCGGGNATMSSSTPTITGPTPRLSSSDSPTGSN